MNSKAEAGLVSLLETVVDILRRQNNINGNLQKSVQLLHERVKILEKDLADRIEQERVDSLHLEDDAHGY